MHRRRSNSDTREPRRREAPLLPFYVPRVIKSCGLVGLLARNRTIQPMTVSKFDRTGRTGYTVSQHLTLKGGNLTPNPGNLTPKRRNLTPGVRSETARKQYNDYLKQGKILQSYAILSKGVCTRGRGLLSQTFPPSPENRVRCVRSAFVPTPSVGLDLTLGRNMGVSTRRIACKINPRFKSGRITGVGT